MYYVGHCKLFTPPPLLRVLWRYLCGYSDDMWHAHTLFPRFMGQPLHVGVDKMRRSPCYPTTILLSVAYCTVNTPSRHPPSLQSSLQNCNLQRWSIVRFMLSPSFRHPYLTTSRISAA
ncbi:hypothetical protein OH77DRAFT_326340 [Trametes cingulata]|nr:hypothetical protein OH77DRAFT_326340 [Trametes cingulata]